MNVSTASYRHLALLSGDQTRQWASWADEIKEVQPGAPRECEMSGDSQYEALANPLVLERIFSNLAPPDIRNVALVSRWAKNNELEPSLNGWWISWFSLLAFMDWLEKTVDRDYRKCVENIISNDAANMEFILQFIDIVLAHLVNFSIGTSRASLSLASSHS